VPDPGGNQLAATVIGQDKSVSDRPAGVGADLVNPDLQRCLHRGRLVGSVRHHLEQPDQPCLPAERLLRTRQGFRPPPQLLQSPLQPDSLFARRALMHIQQLLQSGVLRLE
jgi:hypothetical protein